MDYYVPLSNEIVESIRKQLKIDDKAKFEHSVKLLEEWVSYQSYLPQDYDRVLLSVFIRQCKHDMEKAKKKFRNYFIAMSKVPAIYSDRYSCMKENVIPSRYSHMTVLPQTTPDGYRIFFSKLLSKDPSVIDMQKFMQYMTLIADCRMYGDELCAGDIYVTDAGNITGAHVGTFVNSTIKQLLDLSLDSFPVRIKAIHIITDNGLVLHGINLFKAFLKDKLKEKVFVHKDVESLVNHIPRKCLPADYGGAQKSLGEIVKDMERYIRTKEDMFTKIEAAQLRGPVPKEVDTVTSIEFGVQGSFRKLELD